MGPIAQMNPLQNYQVVLYSRALHPELFELKRRKTITFGQMNFEAWLMPGGHVFRFQSGPLCLTELLHSDERGVPTDGVVTMFPCSGEREFEHASDTEGRRYYTTVQSETLSENLYRATHTEILEFAREEGALTVRWDDPEAGRRLSVLDVQRFGEEIHAQSFHLIAPGGLVIRSQTVFEPITQPVEMAATGAALS